MHHVLKKVVSKLWNNYHNKYHVKAAIDRSLKDMELDYIDLYIIHCKCLFLIKKRLGLYYKDI